MHRTSSPHHALRVDVHQHVWTVPLLEALSARDRLPFVRREDGFAVLHSAGEQPYVIDVEAASPRRRAALLESDGLDLALVAISSPIGIEALPREEADPLIDAHLAGVESLPPCFLAWGPIAIDEADPADVDAVLARGCAGVSVPAGALAGPARLEQLGPVLDRLEQHAAPLFVHPGRAPGQRPSPSTFGEPLWWRALTDYVAEMQAAWLTWAAFGRREHPDLRILFSMLAGGAPLTSERLQARGGPPVDLRDPFTFYDTSSYGLDAISAMARRVGEAQLVYGSDRPVAEPVASVLGTALTGQAAPLLNPRLGALA